MSQRPIPRPIVLSDVFGDTLSVYPSMDEVDEAQAVVTLNIAESAHKQVSWSGTVEALDMLIATLCAERSKHGDARPDLERVKGKRGEPERIRVKLPNSTVWEGTRAEYLEFVRSQSESALMLSLDGRRGAAA